MNYPDVPTRINVGKVAKEQLESMSSQSNLRSRLDVQTIAQDRLREVRRLGTGSTSQVMEVLFVEEPGVTKKYALKCLRRDDGFLSNHEAYENGAVNIVLEGNILARLEHENIIRLHGMSEGPIESAFEDSSKSYCLLLELLQDTLSYRIEKRISQEKNKSSSKRKKKGLSASDMAEMIQEIALPIAKAMEYLHQNGVVLRDLKPCNVGFTSGGVVKLFDFGFAREQHTLTREVAGSMRYMAPEVGLGKGCSFESDVYSFGVMLWELCSLRKPFDKFHSREEFSEDVFVKGYRPSTSSIQSRALRKLIADCWNQDPLARPDFSSIVKALKVEISLDSTKPKLLRNPFSFSKRRNSSKQFSSCSDCTLSTNSSLSPSIDFIRRRLSFSSSRGSFPPLPPTN